MLKGLTVAELAEVNTVLALKVEHVKGTVQRYSSIEVSLQTLFS